MSKKPLSQKVFEEAAGRSSQSMQEFQQIQMALMTAQEELLPELKAAIQGEYIKHPLVVTIGMSNALNNYQLLTRRRDVEQAERDGDWMTFVHTHERPYRIDAFKAVASQMDDHAYWEILADVYIDSESLRLHQEAVRPLLAADRPHRESLMSDEEKAVLDGLPEAVTIFRGYQFDNCDGWSWTIDRQKADWFANRFEGKLEGSVPRVATGKVKKTDIIAYFDGRDEKEIVCDSKSVADITTERLDGK